jgi:hypothetical protein
MLINGIVRIIEEYRFIHSLSRTFPEGNRYIDIVLIGINNVFREVRKIKLDPKASTKVLLTTTPEN